MKQLPWLVRPLETEYKVIGKVLSKHYVYDLTKTEFIAIVMKEANGCMNTKRISRIYDNLMIDAGLKTDEL